MPTLKQYTSGHVLKAMMSTEGELDTYSPAYLAEDDSQRLIDASVAAIVVITIIYAMFLTSRMVYAERNHWEIWVLYPLSYFLCLGICINGVCKSTRAGLLVLCEVSTGFSVLTSLLKCMLKSQARVDTWSIG